MRAPLICLLLLSGMPTFAQSAREEWAHLVATPTDENRRHVAEAVSRCKLPTCAHDVAPDSAAVVKLVSLIRGRSEAAIDLAFLSYRLLDGGDLEDVARSLGEVADTSPTFFLEEVKKHQLLPQQVKGIVRMLPEAVIDDAAQRRRAVSHRIRSLLTVTTASLLDARDQAVATLRRVAGELK